MTAERSGEQDEHASITAVIVTHAERYMMPERVTVVGRMLSDTSCDAGGNRTGITGEDDGIVVATGIAGGGPS